jgi:hypothetical protein
MYVKEDGRDLATWDITGRPERGDQVHRSYKPGDVWEVIAVQWTGSHQARCVCRRVPPNGDEV